MPLLLATPNANGAGYVSPAIFVKYGGDPLYAHAVDLDDLLASGRAFAPRQHARWVEHHDRIGVRVVIGDRPAQVPDWINRITRRESQASAPSEPQRNSRLARATG